MWTLFFVSNKIGQTNTQAVRCDLIDCLMFVCYFFMFNVFIGERTREEEKKTLKKTEMLVSYNHHMRLKVYVSFLLSTKTNLFYRPHFLGDRGHTVTVWIKHYETLLFMYSENHNNWCCSRSVNTQEVCDTYSFYLLYLWPTKRVDKVVELYLAVCLRVETNNRSK